MDLTRTLQEAAAAGQLGNRIDVRDPDTNAVLQTFRSAQDAYKAGVLTEPSLAGITNPAPVYKTNTGKWTTTEPTDASISLDKTTGNIKVKVPKSVAENQEFQDQLDIFKTYSGYYKLDPNAKLKAKNSITGNEEELTVEEYIEQLNTPVDTGQTDDAGNAIKISPFQSQINTTLYANSVRDFLAPYYRQIDDEGNISSVYLSNADIIRMSTNALGKDIKDDTRLAVPKGIEAFKDIYANEDWDDINSTISVKQFRDLWYNREKTDQQQILSVYGDLGRYLNEIKKNPMSVDQVDNTQWSSAYALFTFLSESDPTCSLFRGAWDTMGALVNSAGHAAANYAALGAGVLGNVTEWVVDLTANLYETGLSENPFRDREKTDFSDWGTNTQAVMDTKFWAQYWGFGLGEFEQAAATKTELDSIKSSLRSIMGIGVDDATAQRLRTEGPDPQLNSAADSVQSLGTSLIQLGIAIHVGNVIQASFANAGGAVMNALATSSRSLEGIVKSGTAAWVAVMGAKGVAQVLNVVSAAMATPVFSAALGLVGESIGEAIFQSPEVLTQILNSDDMEPQAREYLWSTFVGNATGLVAATILAKGVKAIGSTARGQAISRNLRNWVWQKQAAIADSLDAIRVKLSGSANVIDWLDHIGSKGVTEAGRARYAQKEAIMAQQRTLRRARQLIAEQSPKIKWVGENADEILKQIDEVDEAISDLMKYENLLDDIARGNNYRKLTMLDDNPLLDSANTRLNQLAGDLVDLQTKAGLKAAGEAGNLKLFSSEVSEYINARLRIGIGESAIAAKKASKAVNATEGIEVIQKEVDHWKEVTANFQKNYGDLVPKADEYVEATKKWWQEFNTARKNMGLISEIDIAKWREEGIWGENGELYARQQRKAEQSDYVIKRRDGKVDRKLERDMGHYNWGSEEEFVDPMLVTQQEFEMAAEQANRIEAERTYSQITGSATVLKNAEDVRVSREIKPYLKAYNNEANATIKPLVKEIEVDGIFQQQIKLKSISTESAQTSRSLSSIERQIQRNVTRGEAQTAIFNLDEEGVNQLWTEVYGDRTLAEVTNSPVTLGLKRYQEPTFEWGTEPLVSSGYKEAGGMVEAGKKVGLEYTPYAEELGFSRTSQGQVDWEGANRPQYRNSMGQYYGVDQSAWAEGNAKFVPLDLRSPSRAEILEELPRLTAEHQQLRPLALGGDMYITPKLSDVDRARFSTILGAEGASELEEALKGLVAPNRGQKAYETGRESARAYLASSTSDEVVALSKEFVPEGTKIYRAVGDDNGLSWTLDKRVAEKYAAPESAADEPRKIIEHTITSDDRIISPEFTSWFSPSPSEKEVIFDINGATQPRDVNKRSVLMRSNEARESAYIKDIVIPAREQQLRQTIDYAMLSYAEKNLEVLGERMDDALDNAVTDVMDKFKETFFAKGSNAHKVADEVAMRYGSDAPDAVKDYLYYDSLKKNKASLAKQVKAKAKEYFQKYEVEVDGKMTKPYKAQAEHLANAVSKRVSARIDVEYNAARSTMAGLGGDASKLLDYDSWQKEIYEVANEIHELQAGSNVIAIPNAAGETEIVQVDPLLSIFVNSTTQYTPQGLLGKANYLWMRLFRLGTTGINPTSWVNQYYRDLGNAWVMGNISETLGGAVEELTEIFGEDAGRILSQYSQEVQENLLKVADEQGKDIARVMAEREVRRGSLYAQSSSESEITRLWRGAKSQWFTNGGGSTTYDKAMDMVDRIEERLTVVNETREKYLRNLVYGNNFAAAIKGGKSIEQARTFAEYIASNATTNFTRGVAFMSQFQNTIPYFRSAINGTRSFYRLWSLDPVGVTGRIIGGLAIPAFALTMFSLSSEENRAEYKKIQAYQKEDALPIVMNGEAFFIPLPQELSAFIAPFRQAAEAISGLGYNNALEVTVNDLLALSPVDFGGFTDIDSWRIYGEGPDWTERLTSGSAQLFSQIMPKWATALATAATGRDLYTGNKIDTSYVTVDPDTGEQRVMSYSAGQLAMSINKLFPNMPAPIIQEALENILGTAGSQVVDFLADIANQTFSGNFNYLSAGESFLEDVAQDLTKPMRPYIEARESADWRHAMSDLWSMKNDILSPNTAEGQAWQSMLTNQRNATTQTERDAVATARANILDPFYKQAMDTVKNLIKADPTAFTDYKMASVMSLFNFGSVGDTVNAAASDAAKTVYNQSKYAAVETMVKIGFPNINNPSILGSIVKSSSTGDTYIKWNTPLQILDMENTLYAQGAIYAADIKNLLTKNGINNQAYQDAYTKYKNETDKEKKKQLAVEWDTKVANAIAPYVQQYNASIISSANDVVDLLDGYLIIPSDYMRYNGKSTYNPKVNAQRGYAKQFIKDVFGAKK